MNLSTLIAHYSAAVNHSVDALDRIIEIESCLRALRSLPQTDPVARQIVRWSELHSATRVELTTDQTSFDPDPSYDFIEETDQSYPDLDYELHQDIEDCRIITHEAAIERSLAAFI